MNKFLARVVVVLKAAPTYLTAIAAVVPLIAGDLAKVMPDQAEDITAWAIRIAAWLTAAALIIRRVTPVDKADRGLLPPT